MLNPKQPREHPHGLRDNPLTDTKDNAGGGHSSNYGVVDNRAGGVKCVSQSVEFRVVDSRYGAGSGANLGGINGDLTATATSGSQRVILGDGSDEATCTLDLG